MKVRQAFSTLLFVLTNKPKPERPIRQSLRSVQPLKNHYLSAVAEDRQLDSDSDGDE